MKNRGPGAQNRGPGVPKSRSRGFPEGSRAYFPCLERAEAFWEPSRVEKVANMAPTWVPRWRPNPLKIDKKFDAKIDGFQDRFYMRFEWILGGKMEASWQQNRRKIDANFERPFFEKTLFFLRKNNDFEGSKGCKIEENSIKNQVKSEGQDGMPLGIDF